MFSPSIAQSGVHRVFYNVTDGNLCSNTDSLDIVVYSLPDASIYNVNPICENGGAITLTTANTGGTFTSTPYLTASGVFDPTLATSGLHKVRYTYTDANGCTNTDSNFVQVDTIPIASITPAGPFCNNSDTIRIAPQVNAGGIFTLSPYIDTIGTFDPSLANIGTNRIYYTFTDGENCSNTDSLDITVYQKPDASISAAGPFCLDEGVQVLQAAVNSGGSFTPTTYLTSSGAFDPSIALSGSHKAIYTYTDANGCSNKDSIYVSVGVRPDARIQADGPFCENEGGHLLSPLTNTGGAFTTTAYISSSGVFNPNTAGAGTHTVFYTFTNANGCSATDSIDIIVNSIPDASITNPGTLCIGQGTQTISAASAGAFTTTPFISSAGLFSPSIAGSGLHKIYFIATDANNCSDTDSTEILVDNTPDASIAPTTPICETQKVLQLMANQAGGSFSGGPYVSANGQFDGTVAKAGSHTVTYTITSAAGCTASDNINVDVVGIPTNTLTLAADKGCEPFNLDISTESAYSLDWTFNNGTIQNKDNIKQTLTQGTYPIQLIVKNTTGCIQNLDTTITVFGNPTADFTFTKEEIFISDAKVEFTDLSSGSITNWDWDFAGLDFSTDQNPISTFTEAGEQDVTLIVTDDNGCTDEISKTVRILEELVTYIPNAFTPNNDGTNDVFRVSGKAIANISIKIFSRNGEQIFESENFQGWDGMYNGEKVQVGNYLYLMTVTDDRKRIHYINGVVAVLNN